MCSFTVQSVNHCVLNQSTKVISVISIPLMVFLLLHNYIRKEGNVLVNDALNTFYLRLYGVRHMIKNHSSREETHCHHYMGYSFLLSARDLLYASSHRQCSANHSLCYTSHGELAGTGNSSMGPIAQ